MAGKNINYTVVERTSPISKKHYVMSQVIPTGSLSFEQLCEDACQGTTLDPLEMQTAVKFYMKAAQKNLLRGFRVPLGPSFLILYPKLEMSVTDKDGKVAKLEDVTAAKAYPTLDCTVTPNYSRAFRMAASFQRVTTKGVIVPEPGEDINEGNKKGDPTVEGGGGSEGGTLKPVPEVEG